MKLMRYLSAGIVALFAAGCVTPNQPAPKAELLPSVERYVAEVARELDQVPEERKAVLKEIATSINSQLAAGRPANLTFICTHNSRRSHMSQIWAQTAACYYGLEDIQAFSGGTEATECNCRTITAMRRAGFEITDATAGKNPIYLVRYSENRPAIKAYSKLYNEDGNPRRDFIALMTCSQADKTCPVIEGAFARHAIHYADPRLCDDTPTETAAYNERCREIAREMFYILNEVRQRRQSG
jgi:arsenate reductase